MQERGAVIEERQCEPIKSKRGKIRGRKGPWDKTVRVLYFDEGMGII